MGRPLYKHIISKINEHGQRNFFLQAQGGSGKTYQMLALRDDCIDSKDTVSGRKLLPLFIDVKTLNEADDTPLFSAMIKYFGNDIHDGKTVLNFFKKGAESEKYAYLILVDGVNEGNGVLREKIFDDLVHIEVSNVYIVVSSRADETRYASEEITPNEKMFLEGCNVISLEPLSVDEYLKKQNIDNSRYDETLLGIIQTPFYMSKFIEIIEADSSAFINKQVRAGDILYKYIETLLSVIDKNENKQSSKTKQEQRFVIKYYIPALAFQMVTTGKMSISSSDFRKICKLLSVDFFTTLLNKEFEDNIQIEDHYKNTIIPNANNHIVDLLLNQVALIEMNNNNGEKRYSFSHQILRDMLAAVHIINVMTLSNNFSQLEIYVNNNIRQFMGELIKTNDGLCECDFESKKDTYTTMSPVESFMQKNYKELNKYPIIITNLIETMKLSRRNSITAIYDNLNLREVNFQNCVLNNSTFRNSYMDRMNFDDYHDSVYIKGIIPSQDTLVIKNEEGEILFLDRKSGRILYTLLDKVPKLRHEEISAVIYSKDGKRIIVFLENSNYCYEINILTFDFKKTIRTELIKAFKTSSCYLYEYDIDAFFNVIAIIPNKHNANREFIIINEQENHKNSLCIFFHDDNTDKVNIPSTADSVSISLRGDLFMIGMTNGDVSLYLTKGMRKIKSYSLSGFGLSGVNYMLFSSNDRYVFCYAYDLALRIDIDDYDSPIVSYIVDTSLLEDEWFNFIATDDYNALYFCDGKNICKSETLAIINNEFKKVYSLPKSTQIKNDFEYDSTIKVLVFSEYKLFGTPKKYYCSLNKRKIISEDQYVSLKKQTNIGAQDERSSFWEIDERMGYKTNISNIPLVLGGESFRKSKTFNILNNKQEGLVFSGNIFFGNDQLCFIIRKLSDDKIRIEKYFISDLAKGNTKPCSCSNNLKCFEYQSVQLNASANKMLLLVKDDYKVSALSYNLYLYDVIKNKFTMISECFVGNVFTFTTSENGEIVRVVNSYEIKDYSSEIGQLIHEHYIDFGLGFTTLINDGKIIIRYDDNELSVVDIERNKIIFKKQFIMSANIANCDFNNALFADNIDNSFLTKLYFNGAKGLDEYKPQEEDIN